MRIEYLHSWALVIGDSHVPWPQSETQSRCHRPSNGLNPRLHPEPLNSGYRHLDCIFSIQTITAPSVLGAKHAPTRCPFSPLVG